MEAPDNGLLSWVEIPYRPVSFSGLIFTTNVQYCEVRFHVHTALYMVLITGEG